MISQIYTDKEQPIQFDCCFCKTFYFDPKKVGGIDERIDVFWWCSHRNDGEIAVVPSATHGVCWARQWQLAPLSQGK
jgi:hypothetical protein